MTTAVLNSKVLELNKLWQPIKVITVPEAVKKVMKGVARIVDMYDMSYSMYSIEDWQELSTLRYDLERDDDKYRWIKLASDGVMLLPRVIRVLTYDKMGRNRVRFSRRNVYMRDHYTCQYCGKQFDSTDLNLDHVVPTCQGGITIWENIVCSCFSCNTKKGGRTPQQAGMKLIRQPIKPKWNPIMDMPKDIPSDWNELISKAYWNVELKES